MEIYECVVEGSSRAKALVRTLDFSATGVIANRARQVHGTYAGFPDGIRQYAEKRMNRVYEKDARVKTYAQALGAQIDYVFRDGPAEGIRLAYLNVEEEWHGRELPLGPAMLDPFGDFLGMAQLHAPKTAWGFYSNIWHPWGDCYWGTRGKLTYLADKQAHFKRVIAPFLRERGATLYTNVYHPYAKDPYWAEAARAHLTVAHKAVKGTAGHYAMLSLRQTSGTKELLDAGTLAEALEVIGKLGFIDGVLLWHDVNDEAGRDQTQRYVEEVLGVVVGRATADRVPDRA